MHGTGVAAGRLAGTNVGPPLDEIEASHRLRVLKEIFTVLGSV